MNWGLTGVTFGTAFTRPVQLTQPNTMITSNNQPKAVRYQQVTALTVTSPSLNILLVGAKSPKGKLSANRNNL